MNTQTTLHPLAEDYLKQLRRRARDLPRGRRDELLADIEAHLAETASAASTEAEVRTALDRLGSPDDIVSAEEGSQPLPGRRGALEWCAIVLLLIGGVVIPVIGWIVGAVLLWISRAWTLRDKVVGTLILPGGLLPAVWLVIQPVTIESCGGPAGGRQTCTGAPTTTQQTINIAFFVAAVVLPICTAVYLSRRAQRPRATR